MSMCEMQCHIEMQCETRKAFGTNPPIVGVGGLFLVSALAAGSKTLLDLTRECEAA